MDVRYLSAFLLVMITGCSLFVAEPAPREGEVCVPADTLNALLEQLNMTIDDLTELPEAEDSILDIAVADGRFTTLVQAVQAAELEEALASDGPLTVFAPTDEAFADLPPGLVEALLQNPQVLREILLFHVSDSRLTSAAIMNIDSVPTLHGQSIAVRMQDGAVMLNDARVIIADIPASNGIIHVIDAVLIPTRDAEEEPGEQEPGEPATPPEEDDIPARYFTEGELVRLAPQATDPDGDEVTFTFTAPLDANGEWQTAEGDAGEYLVTVTASDGKASVSQQVRIVVEGGNRPPAITGVNDMTVTAGETVVLSPQVSDPDGDDVTVTYSGWMTQSTYTTVSGDEGEHFVTVTASDGRAQTVAEVRITVLRANRAPVIADIQPIRVTEGELVQVNAVASDPDGDEVTLSYSAPLSADGTWQTAAGDAGTYLVTVTASDGSLESRKTVSVVVESANSPPVIQLDDVTVIVQAGQTAMVELNPVVTDPDGDDVTVSFAGWMTSATRQVTEDDEGSHQVTVTASDGISQTSRTITVTVEVNRPPQFII